MYVVGHAGDNVLVIGCLSFLSGTPDFGNIGDEGTVPGADKQVPTLTASRTKSKREGRGKRMHVCKTEK